MTRPPRPLAQKVLIAAAVLLCGTATVFLLAAAIPTVASNALEMNPPFSTTRAQRPGHGCALTEQRVRNECQPAKPTGVREEEVAFASPLDRAITELRGTLSLPQGLRGPRPAAVLVHGSGPNGRDGETAGDLLTRHARYPMLAELAKVLSGRGIVVLRYDKRSCAACYNTEFEPGRDTFLDYRDDARAALDYLKSRPEVDKRRLLVLGHSQGGQLAPHIAQGREDVAAVVALAGILQPFLVNGHRQYERYADLRRRQLDYIAPWSTRSQVVHLKNCVASFGSAPRDEPCEGMGPNPRWVWHDYHELGQRTFDTIKNLRVPVLWVQGNADLNADPNDATRLADLGPDVDTEVHLLDGVTHSMIHLDDAATPKLAPSLVDTLLAFLGSVRPAD